MAGGVLQLFAYGAEDLYFTSNPQITFYKIVYRRHTNFSTQTFERTFLDNPDFDKLIKTKIYRLGDLITKMMLKITVKGVVPKQGTKFGWVRRLGLALLKFIRIEIGGQIIDEQCGEWIDIWLELSRVGNHERGYAMIGGDVPEMTGYNNKPKPQYDLYIPLIFWFNKFIGLALPIIAIQYHEIFVTIKLAKRDELVVRSENWDQYNDLQILDAGLLVDYVYLDLVEREKFATIGHEYLIEQVQHTGEEHAAVERKRIQLHFNHPVKELIWAMRNGNYRSNKRFLTYSNTDDWSDAILAASVNLLKSSIILLDGPIYKTDENGNIIEDQYGVREIIGPGEAPPENGEWEEMITLSTTVTENGKITVQNNSETKSLWINVNSLKIGLYSLASKISATIQVSSLNHIFISDVVSTVTERDISIPIELFEDTRITSDDVIVNQFSNYGVLITGRYNPLQFAKLEFNDQERVEKRNGKFFGVLQPEMHHTNTPRDGVNLYSFALKPEEHQPSGASNFSRIEKIIFTAWYGDITYNKDNVDEPSINLLNKDNRFYIFALSYNVLRVMSGLTALVYTD